MTTRPEAGALQMQRKHRGRTICTLLEIIRNDGVVLRFTDHDRPLTQGSATFSPLNLAGLSAERREAGLRSGNQEVTGIIDGGTITIPDLLGDRYRGARVRQQLVDWRMPWLVVYAERKTVRQIKWDGTRWVATVETAAAKLQRPAPGTYGGLYNTTCYASLGDDRCKKDISADVVTGAVVQSVTDSRMVFSITAASWPATYADDYYRDGEIQWTSGANAGAVSPIVQHLHGDPRQLTLLLPTPFDIEPGDEGTLRPGCDGLRTTCISKFDNLDNFRASPFEPGAQSLAENPE